MLASNPRLRNLACLVTAASLILLSGGAGATHNGNHGYGNQGNGTGNGEAPDVAHLTDCTIEQGLFPIPYAEAAARVPEPFQASTYFQSQGAPRDPGPASGELDIGFLRCAGGDGGLGAHEQVLAIIILAPPTAQFKDAEITTYAYILQAATPTATLQAWFSQWNLPAEQGTVSHVGTGLAGGFDDTLSVSSGSVGLRAAALPAPADRPAEGYRFFYEGPAGWEAMDLLVEPHHVDIGASDWTATAWPGALPTPGPGIAGAVTAEGWDMTMRHVEFPAGVQMMDCENDQGLFFIPYAEADARVPAPFVPGAYFGLQPSDSSAPTSRMDIAFMRCSGGDAVLGASEQELAGIILDTPPAPYGEPGILTYYYVLGFSSPTASLRSLYGDWGAVVEPATVSYSPTPLGGITDTAAIGGATLTMQTDAMARDTAELAAETIRFLYPTADGIQAIDAHVGAHWLDAGAGTWSTAGTGGWVATLPTPTPGAVTTAGPGWNITLEHVRF